MPKSKQFSNRLLSHVLNNIPLANIASGLPSSSEAGAVYLSLHHANPVSMHQGTYEASYEGYARIAVVRDGTGWKILDNKAALVKDATFPKITEDADKVITWLGVGSSMNGHGMILWSGKLSTPIRVKKGVVPRIKSGTTIEET